jgi:hypothetical protein
MTFITKAEEKHLEVMRFGISTNKDRLSLKKRFDFLYKIKKSLPRPIAILWIQINICINKFHHILKTLPEDELLQCFDEFIVIHRMSMDQHDIMTMMGSWAYHKESLIYAVYRELNLRTFPDQPEIYYMKPIVPPFNAWKVSYFPKYKRDKRRRTYPIDFCFFTPLNMLKSVEPYIDEPEGPWVKWTTSDLRSCIRF